VQEKKKLRALAVILPQFHPFPENDEWWGKGFTEWTNTVKARPRFKGHYQPHLPADLGFYDLRLADTREQQAALAKEYGIHGFCIHHYWFNGKLLMERPVQGMIQSGTPDFPFMLCWANENWTRRWDGQDQEVLIKQDYSPEDHKAHAKWLCENIFNDSRYITVDGKPFFLFFNTHIIPDLKETIKIWRDEVKRNGFEDIYLAGVRTAEDAIPNSDELGFDATIEWQPDWKTLNVPPNYWNRIKNKLNLEGTYRKIDYDEVVKLMLAKKDPKNKHFECIMPSWDNTARRKVNAFIIDKSTPEKYKNWLEKVCENAQVYSKEENFVFINAWNEWAEGNHLEPDKKWGLAYLEKTKEVLDKY
jgi:lipopolysaccharide biosynthesis protein